jgi:hypothetical protein
MKNDGLCSCGNQDSLHLVYNFGLMPHVNNYKLKNDKGLTPKYPLRLMFCDKCKLLQLSEMPNREEIYCDYDHISSASPANAQHLKSISENINNSESSKKTILEVGCNDATLLRNLNKKFNVYGIDPAINVYNPSNEDSFSIIHDFFDLECTKKIKEVIGKPIDIIVGINVFAHNKNYAEMFKAISELLNDDGYAHIEVAYAVDTIMSANFDTIYHEHFCNYTLISLNNIISSSGLKISNVERIPTQGGSLRIIVRKNSYSGPISKSVEKLLKFELENNYDKLNFYLNLSHEIQRKVDVIKSLFTLKNLNKDILIVGVPARGVITANVCGFENLKNAIAFDDTPDKQGRLLPGTNIHIKHPSEIEFKKYKIACLLAWTYKENLITRLKDYGFKGDLFIPFPEPKYVKI